MLQIILLGPPTLVLNGQPLTDQVVTRKAKALFIYLAMQSKACSRESLATLLWGDWPQNNAYNSLRHALSHLNRQFEGYLDIRRDTVLFNRQKPYGLDTESFEAAIVAETSLETFHSIIDLYRGKFLAGFSVRKAPEFEAWMLLERDRFQQTFVSYLQQAVAQCLNQQEYQVGLTYVEQLLTQEPWLETAHQHKMTLLTHIGQPQAAVQHYQEYQKALECAFKTKPVTALKQLYEQIQTGTLEEQNQLGIQLDDIWPGGLDPQVDSNVDKKRAWLQTVPQIDLFYGRDKEVASLIALMVDKAERLVAIAGIGGQGKTSLAARLCQNQAIIDHFDYIVWQSLINAPPLEIIVENLLQFFYGQQPNEIPTHFEAQQYLLFEQLQRQRCLLIFDNLESILQDGNSGYQAGYENYGYFILQVGQTEHQSCLLVTSREIPSEVSRLARDTTQDIVLSLGGINVAIAQQILQTQQILASAEQIQTLVERYSGNPLALKLVSDTIGMLFWGDVAAFLAEEVAFYDQIQDVLKQQITRLSELEETILIWLAIEREAMDMQTLWRNLYAQATRSSLLSSLTRLKNRSLLHTSAQGFGLQNVVMEYLSERLVEEVCQEISSGKLQRVQQFALIIAQSKDYIRQTQVRVFLRPVAKQLVEQMGKPAVEKRLQTLLSIIQTKSEITPGYIAGNIINLLVYLGADLRGYDFSNLAIWQAYLQDTHLPDVDFSGSDLTGSRFLNASYRTRHVTFSPNGAYLATTHFHSEVRLWRTADLTPLRTFERGDIWTGSAIFSPDGQWLAGNGQDHLIYVWNYKTGETVYILAGHTNEIPTLSFSPDSQWLASGSFDKAVILWDMNSGKQAAILEGHENWIYSIAFGADGDLLASADTDGLIRLWSVKHKTCEHILSSPADRIDDIAISPDGLWLASAAADRIIRIWNLQTRSIEQSLPGHENMLCSLAFSPDGQILASTGYDGTIRLWQVAEGRLLRTLLTHTNLGFALDFHPDGIQLVSCDEVYPIRIWNTETGQLLYTQKSPRQNESHQLLFNPDGGQLISSHLSAEIRLWHIQQPSYQVITRRAKTQQYKRYITLRPDCGQLFVSYGSDIQIWTLPEMELAETRPSQSVSLGYIAIDHQSKKLASVGIEYTIWIEDIQTKRLEHALEGHTNWIVSLKFSPDDALLASSSYDYTVRLWDTKSGECIFQTKRDIVSEVLFSADSRYLIIGDSNTITVWEVATGKQLRTFASYKAQDAVCPLAITTQGDVVASVAQDHTILLWSYQQGTIIRTLEGHGSTTSTLTFNPNGTILATTSVDETIQLWEVATGKNLTVLEIEPPYKGMNIANTIGLTSSTRQALKQLGAADLP